MNWLSKSGEVLIEICTKKSTSVEKSVTYATTDVAVVGSGYGGAVAALRFAEHGEKVYVLERGQEYVSGEFPNDLSQVGKHVRAELASLSGITTQGYEEALFDFRIGLRAGALVGNGLGGGSLINAGVGLKPDPRVFKQDEWPAALRQADLQKYYAVAHRTLELQTAANGDPVDLRQTAKYRRLEKLGRAANKSANHPADDALGEVSVTFEQVPIAVQLHDPVEKTLGLRKACNGCGDCVTGCNNHAKLSLTATYLPRAVKAGAEIFTGLTVLRISHEPAGNDAFPWVVHFLRSAERKIQHDIQCHARQAQQSPPAADKKSWVYQLRARRVVLGAGTFGSSEILLRSRAEGLQVSNTALGVGVSGNGDDVSFGFDLKEEVNAVGWGSKPPVQTPVGPTISGAIRFTDPKNLKNSTLIQDGSVPGLMGGVVHELLTSLGVLAQMGSWGMRAQHGGDPLTLKPQALLHSLTLLGMGHDTAGGVIVLDDKSGRVGWGWPKAADETTPALHKERMKECVKELGGLYIQNPAVSAIPDSLGDVLKGPKPGGALFTVHPLGGCRMGDTMLDGVVNHWGEVWKENDQVHDGLYVLDGSTMPSSLGVNPMLTITALAERSCEMILMGMDAAKENQKAREIPKDPAFPDPLRIPESVHSGARLAEVLRGKMALTVDADLPNIHDFFKTKKTLDAALFLEFDIPSWPEFFDDKDHTVAIVSKSGASSSAYTRSRLVMNDGKTSPALELEVVSGFANFYRLRHDFWPTRACRYVRTGLTYLVGRWLPDDKKKEKSFLLWRLLKFLLSVLLTPKFYIDALKLIGHANQSREFYYEIKLTDHTHHYLLTGTKKIEAAASCAALFDWSWNKLTTREWLAPVRPSIWQQLTQINATLSACAASGFNPQPLATGRLVMDLPDMLRRVTPQLGLNRDNITALMELAGYPIWLLRAILQTRLLDFRAPDYQKDLPDADPATISKPLGYFELDDVKYPDIPAPLGGLSTPAQIQRPLLVPLTWSKVEGVEPELIRIGLVRYKASKLNKKQVGSICRAQSIVLINGFLLSTQSFVATELNPLGGNLAAQLHAAGWDVWMLEYRASPLLDVSARESNMDDIAAFDIPCAVDYVLKTVSEEFGTRLEDTQIFAYSRCVGSGALAMSLLSGFLRHSNGTNKLAGVQLSDFHPFLVGSVSAQLRLQVAAFLSGVLKLKYVQFTAGNVKSDLLHTMMDRIFSSVDYAYQDNNTPRYLHEVNNERCPHEHDLRKHQPESTTCKRITGLMSRSYRHAQLLPETHKKLDFYFGRGNMGVFLQGAKCVTQERLVNADGQNAYVTDESIQSCMNMPLLLVHGAHNALFDLESFERSKGQFQRLLPDVPGQMPNQYLRFEDFGHVDLILGREAPKTVIPKVVAFFNAALTAPLPADRVVNNRCRARMARTGPIVGWVRPGQDENGESVTLIRVWIEVDDTHADRPIAALTVVEYAGQKEAQVWPYQKQKFRSQGEENPEDAINPFNAIHPLSPGVCYAVADVAVPTEHIDHVSIHMVSIHTYADPQVPTNSQPNVGLPLDWGKPMRVDELDGSKNETPWSASLHVDRPIATPLNSRPGNTLTPFQQLSPMVPAAALPFEPSPPYSKASEANTRNSRLIPTHKLAPTADIASLLDPLKHELQQGNEIAHKADPKTLSRQIRSLRVYGERILQLKRRQLQDANSGSVTFFAAACRHPGLTGFETRRADASLRRAGETIDDSQPRFMLMLGDQIYADARAGVIDTESPIEKLLSRYHDAFGESQSFRKIAQRLPLYMVMDDHEINDCWSHEQVLQSNLNEVLAENAKAAFTIFQYEHGPGLPSLQNPPQRVEGFNYSYEHNGVPFLVLDTRTQRTRVPRRRILHTSQWCWLEGWLRREQRAKGNRPKFVVSGSVIAPCLLENIGRPTPRLADSWQMCEEDRERLLSFIANNNIENVMFLSSDYHCSAAAEINFRGKNIKAWAIVAPPLHAPMRFANSEAAEVLLTEVIQLAGHAATIKAKAWDGEGWLDCSVNKNSNNGYKISLKFHLRKLEDPNWPQDPCVMDWTLD